MSKEIIAHEYLPNGVLFELMQREEGARVIKLTVATDRVTLKVVPGTSDEDVSKMVTFAKKAFSMVHPVEFTLRGDIDTTPEGILRARFSQHGRYLTITEDSAALEDDWRERVFGPTREKVQSDKERADAKKVRS